MRRPVETSIFSYILSVLVCRFSTEVMNIELPCPLSLAPDIRGIVRELYFCEQLSKDGNSCGVVMYARRTRYLGDMVYRMRNTLVGE